MDSFLHDSAFVARPEDSPSLFDLSATPAIPGFRYEPEIISDAEERELLGAIQALDFQPVVMHGVPARRRVVQFGSHYSFASRSLAPAAPIPEWLLDLRERVSLLAPARAEELAEALVTEYESGAGIGWHRDAPPFGIVVGVSLLSACQMRLRPRKDDKAPATSVHLAPRSAYVFDAEARREWLHSIRPVKELRYSITFRTLRA
jgi:alkylated DNA repair dioxygenase AlkB